MTTYSVRACKQGDAAAFEELVGRYDRMLFASPEHVTHNREDAQDAVQEAFLKVFRKLSQFQEKSRSDLADPHHDQRVTDEAAKATRR